MADNKKSQPPQGKCRFCGQVKTVLPNDTLADHNVSMQTPRRCFGSGMGPAVG